MVEGYFPSSGGLKKLHQTLTSSYDNSNSRHSSRLCFPDDAFGVRKIAERKNQVAGFYKCWDTWGSLSNFSPHSIWMADGTAPTGRTVLPDTLDGREWPSVEHYYQAQKFMGEAKFLCKC